MFSIVFFLVYVTVAERLQPTRVVCEVSARMIDSKMFKTASSCADGRVLSFLRVGEDAEKVWLNTDKLAIFRR